MHGSSNQAFSSKDKSKKSKCRLLQFLFSALRVKAHPNLRIEISKIRCIIFRDIWYRQDWCFRRSVLWVLLVLLGWYIVCDHHKRYINPTKPLTVKAGPVTTYMGNGCSHSCRWWCCWHLLILCCLFPHGFLGGIWDWMISVPETCHTYFILWEKDAHQFVKLVIELHCIILCCYDLCWLIIWIKNC